MDYDIALEIRIYSDLDPDHAGQAEIEADGRVYKIDFRCY